MGTLLSIAIALILVILGQDQITSLMIGLIAIAITLAIDIVARLKETEKRIVEANALGNILSIDQELHSTLEQIATDYLATQAIEFDLFTQKAKDVLLECKNILDDLKNGQLITEVGGKYSYGKKGTEAAKKTVKAVAYEDIESWRSEHIKGVIRSNAEAVKRGVQVQRVFILSKESLTKASEILQQHKDAGVQTFVVSPDDLPSTQFFESYLIVDDKILVVFYFTRDGQRFREEKISIEPVEVDRAISRFASILRHAKSYE